MFNLDQAIADWRRQMAAGGIKTAEVLDELESHLRDDVEQQMRSGSSAQQAFEAAVQRMGQVSALKAEFMKAAGAVRAPLWKRELIPGSLLSFWQKNQRLAGALASGVMVGCVLLHQVILCFLSEPSPVQRRLWLAGFALFALSACSFPCWHRFLPVVHKRVRRKVEVVGGCLLGAWVASFIIFSSWQMGRFSGRGRPGNFDGRLLWEQVWAGIPVILLVALIVGLHEAAKRGTEATGS